MTQRDLTAIIEWLYTNDGGYPNKVDWRLSFIQMLKGLAASEKMIVTGDVSLEAPGYHCKNLCEEHTTREPQTLKECWCDADIKCPKHPERFG